MSKLSDDLKSYAEKYPTHIKGIFFNKVANMINENKLTLATLTSELLSLETKQRIDLFATTSWLEMSVLAESDAAALIKRLYHALGVKLNQHTLNLLVNGNELSEAQQKKLYSGRYEQWRRAPLYEETEQALLHELKGSLELNNQTNKKRSLPELLQERWKLNEYATFEYDLLTLIRQAPQYMPRLLELINVQFGNHKKQFIDHLLNAAETDNFILSLLLKSHPELVIHWIIKKPADYFRLTKPMQVAVLRLLKEEPKLAQETLEIITKAAQKVADVHGATLAEILLNSKTPQTEQPKRLKNEITQLIWEKAPEFIKKDQKREALQVIQKYLNQQPNKYKQDFFIKLAKEIKENGFSIELLKRHLNDSHIDKKLLFAKWTGLVNSRAAEVMAALYQIASLDKKLNNSQMNTMVNQGDLPTEPIDQASFIQTKVQEVLTLPNNTPSYLTQYIGDIVAEMQAKAEFLANNQREKQHLVEAIYQQYLIEQGLKIASMMPNPIFDPQGHVILYMTLEKGDYELILQKLGEKKKESLSAKEQVEALLNTKITNPTLCNLDIGKHEVLKEKFTKWIGNDRIANLLINADSRSSIIQLQEELSMHVLLSLRVLEKDISKDNINLNSAVEFRINNKLRSALLVKINEAVQKAVQVALDNSFKNNTINMVTLNRELDQARKQLAPKCREMLVQLIYEFYPDTDWEIQLEKVHKHDFTKTTATGIDYLHSDARNQTSTRISATEQTAHDKKIGEENQAFRVLYRNHYDAEQGIVTPHVAQTIEARVPSIADKEAPAHIGVKDVALKLRRDHYLLQEQATDSNSPMIYNLLTSLHTAVYDVLPFFELQNRQRLSADYILQGAHLYNLQQMKAGHFKALVYVQNIPVNQHTNKLDDKAFDDVTKEASIMTDIALLSTLQHHAGVFSSSMRQDLENTYSFVHQKYLSFLPKIEKGNSLFHKTKVGHIVKDVLSVHKHMWDIASVIPLNNDSLNTLAVKALFKIYAKNEHRNPQFGMLVQTLSVFVEPISLAGCKSANERYQGVSGRVELLKSIASRAEKNLSLEEQKLKNELRKLIEGKGTLAKLQECLDIAYNRHNLQGAAAAISFEDQGAGSKIETTKNKAKPGVISELNTNVAETGFLTKLFQSSCSAMQSHKAKLLELFKALFKKEKEAIHSQLMQLP